MLQIKEPLPLEVFVRGSTASSVALRPLNSNEGPNWSKEEPAGRAPPPPKKRSSSSGPLGGRSKFQSLFWQRKVMLSWGNRRENLGLVYGREKISCTHDELSSASLRVC